MSTFAERQQDLMTRLNAVTKFGNSVTFTDTPQPYDPDDGKTTPGTPVVFATTAGGPIGVNPRLINGTTIQQTDQMIIVEASQMPFDIDLNTTTLEINSRTYAITSIEPFRTNDIDIGFRLIIR